MPKGRTSTSGRASQEDSLVVHPATQGKSANESLEINLGSGTQSEDNKEDSQGFWEAEAILDEVKNRYLIAWKGKDENGEPWKPTWEPKQNANSLLVEAWLKHRKAEKIALKQQRVAEKAKAKADKKAKQRQARSRASTSSTSSNTSVLAVEDQEEDQLEESLPPMTLKRKMVVPDSDSSQSQPIKKQKRAKLPGAKKVSFEADLGGTANPTNSPQPQKRLSSATATSAKRATQPYTQRDRLDARVADESIAAAGRSGKGLDTKAGKKDAVEDRAREDTQEDTASSGGNGQAEDLETRSVTKPQERPESQETVIAAASSGTAAASLVPDSQQVGNVPSGREADEIEDSMVASQLAPVSSAPSTFPSRIRPPLPFDSPTTSHSDLDMQPLEDDVPIFDPLQHTAGHSSSEPETTEARRPLGPVPIPTIAAFGLHEQRHPVSSQLDPIEDPDSSPHRSPFRRSQQQHTASPAPRPPRPAKARLELVAAVNEESPASFFEAEVASSAAASYVSLPITIDPHIVRPPGGSPLRPFAPRLTGSSSYGLKRPFARPPSPSVLEGISIGGGAVAAVTLPIAAPRSPSPEVVSEETQLFSQPIDDGALQDEWINEYFDFSASAGNSQLGEVLIGDGTQGDEQGGEEPQKAVGGKAAGEAADAGEGYPPAGYAPHGPVGAGGAPADASGAPSVQPGPSQIPGYIPPGAVPIGFSGAFAGAPGYPGGGLPPMHLPSAHTMAPSPCPPQPTKRDREGREDEASKKARTEQPTSHLSSQASPPPPPPSYLVPMAFPPAPYHSTPVPISMLPTHPAPFLTHSYSQGPIPLPSPYPYPMHPAIQTPALNVISPSPVSSGVPIGHSTPTHPAVNNRHAAAPSSPAVAANVSNAPPAPSSAPTSAAVRNSPPLLSRTSSPGPGGGGTKVDEVIALVISSPYILGTDGTKAEIERFLRDPRAYIVLKDAPLARAEFWAFELRRHSVEGVEKVDFIIIRSREGNFQLKRAPADKLPVEFARSLAHTSTHVRGSTPAGEALAVGGTSPQPAGPPPPSQMTRDQLEQEILRLREATATFEAELFTLRPLAVEAAKLRTDYAALQKSNKQLQNSREAAQDDLSYMQAQYQSASSAAVDRANEAEVAEAEAARLRVLLDTGLKQKELLHAAKEKKLKAEAEKLKKETSFYRETMRRSEMREIRENSAMWEEYGAGIRRREEEERRRAAGETIEEDEDTESEDEDGPMTNAAQAQPVTEADLVAVAATSSSPDFVAAGDISISTFPSSSVPEPSTLSSFTTLGGSTQVLGPAPSDFRCEWRIGSESQAEACGAVCLTREDLGLHVRGHLGA
ncbi:hypothetical protein JCM11641_005915 [Rhodosporidiobolus odoratus]